MGAGAGFSAISVLIYEGGIAVVAHLFSAKMNSPLIILDISSVGGLLIAAIGVNILETKKIHIADMLPSLIVVAILQWVLSNGQVVWSYLFVK